MDKGLDADVDAGGGETASSSEEGFPPGETAVRMTVSPALQEGIAARLSFAERP